MFYTYQDFLKVWDSGKAKAKFVYTAIQNHKLQDDYELAIIAEEYYEHKNRTIVNFQKLLYKVDGRAVPDTFSANYKLSRNFFKYFE